MFFACFVISCSINPIVDKLEKKMPRTIATYIVIFGLLAIVLLIFVPVCTISLQEIKVFAVNFPKYVDKFDDYLLKIPFFNHFSTFAVDFNNIMDTASNSSADILNNVLNISKNIGSAVIYMLISIIIIFNMVCDKTRIKNFYLHVFPSNLRNKAEEIGLIISNKMGGYLIALITTMFGVGFVMWLGLEILHIHYALLLGIITGVFDIVPIVGPFFALIVCLITTYQFGFETIMAVLIIFAIAQITENNFVRPFVFGKFLQLHPLVVFLFLLLAAKFMGVIGVIFAPAVAALVVVLFEELYLKNLD